MTGTVLTSNNEWNTKFVSTQQGELTKELIDGFYQLWNFHLTITFSFKDIKNVIKL